MAGVPRWAGWKSLPENGFQKLPSGASNLPGVFAIILRTFWWRSGGLGSRSGFWTPLLAGNWRSYGKSAQPKSGQTDFCDEYKSLKLCSETLWNSGTNCTNFNRLSLQVRLHRLWVCLAHYLLVPFKQIFETCEYCTDLDSPQLTLPPRPSPSIPDHKTWQGMPWEHTEGFPTLRWWPESVFPGFPEMHIFA